MVFPDDFISRTTSLSGVDVNALFASLQEPSPVSIRINPEKTHMIPAEGIRIPWCSNGYYLPERPSFTFDPLFHTGSYYVQEASSMFLEQAIRTYIENPVTCLDLCAAPGGKSTLLSSVLPAGSLLLSNEVIRSRANILAENVIKWGYPFSVVTQNDPVEIGILTHLFDVIVADVPCSGEGMFRKDPASIQEWSVGNVDLCAARQRRIIQDIWNSLAPGGLLIYSTCTYNLEENEENVRYIVEELGAEPLPIPVKEEWNITGALKYNYPVYRFLPYKTKGEGFFLAVMRKYKEEVHKVRSKSGKKKEKQKTSIALSSQIKDYIIKPEQFSIETTGEKINAIPLEYRETIMLIAERLRILHAGIVLGEIKGKDIIPSQSLVQSQSMNKNAFPSIEITYEDAIHFLRKEAIYLEPGINKGYIVVTYKNHPLGFVKHLGNRTNNLYPSEWRIRSPHLPTGLSLIYFE